ncbi:MAG: MBL fold metallo-hydrolase [Polyangiaceae bacterium]|nr:MBL fold metallo-hydrolase [Polyangiaceae bacterium]
MSMVERLSLRVLVDDAPGEAGLLTEHGFACWVSTDQGAVLFDTGVGGALLPNAARLGVDLGRADALVLSHGHYDHTGGIAPFLAQRRVPLVLAHPAFDGPHYSRSSGDDREVGLPDSARLALAGSALERRSEPSEPLPGLWATGEIPRLTDEDVGGPFFADREGVSPDPLLDDQALIVRHRSGLVILLGCAHSGVINTVRYARRLFPGEAVRAVIGGMHLRNAPSVRIDATLAELIALDEALVGPAHCTGEHPQRALRAGLGGRYRRVVVGSVLELGPAGEWRCA